MSKIYCKGCRWVKKHAYSWPEDCKHPETLIYYDTALEHCIVNPRIENINGKNDCPRWESRKRIFPRIRFIAASKIKEAL